jgi:hypothetical protein
VLFSRPVNLAQLPGIFNLIYGISLIVLAGGRELDASCRRVLAPAAASRPRQRARPLSAVSSAIAKRPRRKPLPRKPGREAGGPEGPHRRECAPPDGGFRHGRPALTQACDQPATRLGVALSSIRTTRLVRLRVFTRAAARAADIGQVVPEDDRFIASAERS